MSLYDKNLAFIKQHNFAVYQALTGDIPVEDGIEYLAATDNYIISRNSMRILLHSEYNREREFELMLSAVEPAIKTIVLFGIGNGQLLELINSRFPDLDHLVIIEPNVRIMRSFLERHDFVKSFSVFYKASFIVGKPLEEARQILETLVLSMDFIEKKISLIAPIAYRTLYADYYNALAQGALKAVRFHRVNKNTMELLRTHWLVNACRNLKYVAPDIGVLENIFAGMPAIIVSAGPSLQKNMHLLREARDRALIIAVGSAISILDSNNIVPHFRIAVDATVENRPLFEKVDTAACPLIYSDHLFHEIVPNYNGRKVHMTSAASDPFIFYLYNRASIDAMFVRSGFSVANVALYLLLQFKCNPIVFMGQDLCYTRGKLHAEGAWDEQIEERYIKKQVETVDILGNEVYTDAAFLGMKKIFEDIIADNPSIRFLNATEGGLAIEGANNVTLADLLTGELSTICSFADIIEKILAAEAQSVQDKAEKLNNIITTVEADIEVILGYCARIDEQYKKVYQMLKTNVKKDRIQEETRNLQRLIKKLDGVEFYTEVVKPFFAEKISIRRGAVDYKNDDWRKQWGSEIGLLRLEMDDVSRYIHFLQALLEEYRGKRQLNIIFE